MTVFVRVRMTDTVSVAGLTLHTRLPLRLRAIGLEVVA